VLRSGLRAELLRSGSLLLQAEVPPLPPAPVPPLLQAEVLLRSGL